MLVSTEEEGVEECNNTFLHVRFLLCSQMNYHGHPNIDENQRFLPILNVG
jgi:hypothetical protein